MKTPTRKLIFIVAIVGFALSAIWENIHFPLYVNFASWMKHIFFALCALGDVFLILCVYSITAAVYRDIHWLHSLSAGKLTTALVISVLLSIIAEGLALYLGWWDYTDRMPTIPPGIGLSPFLAIALLPVITFLISRKINQIL